MTGTQARERESRETGEGLGLGRGRATAVTAQVPGRCVPGTEQDIRVYTPTRARALARELSGGCKGRHMESERARASREREERATAGQEYCHKNLETERRRITPIEAAVIDFAGPAWRRPGASRARTAWPLVRVSSCSARKCCSPPMRLPKRCE